MKENKSILDVIGGTLALQVTTLGWGGTERYVQDLTIAYAQRELRPLVIVDSEPLCRKESIENAGAEVVCLGINKQIRNKEYSTLLGNVLQKYNVGLLHSNAWVRQEWIQDICRVNNVKFIKTMHGTVVFSLRRLIGLTWPKNWWKLWSYMIRARRTCPAFISISNLSLNGSRRLWGKQANTKMVCLGVPAVAKKAEPDSNGTAPTFIWVGSLIPRKQPMLMVRAFKKVLEKYPDCSLTIAGDGPLRERCQAFTEVNMPGKVKFLGFTNRVGNVLAQSQIFVLTSKSEGLPYAILEAMAAGLPVVTTNCGAVTEAVVDGTTGIVVPLNDKKSLAAAMLELAAEPSLRKKMGQGGYQRWQNEFSIGKMINNTLKAYRILLDL